MSKPDIVSSVERFCADAKSDPDHLVQKIQPMLAPSQQQDLKTQVETLPGAIRNVINGKMSYSEMRAMYG